jgi:hypothetical protein
MHRINLVPLAVLLACAGSALAQSSPYTVGASETVSRISNLYNRADGDPGAVDATLFSTAVFGSVDQTFGRQRVYGNANLANNRYTGVSGLGNNSYNLGAGWDWSTIERLAGTLRLDAGRSLAPFYGLAGVTNTQPNIQTFRSAAATARLGLVTRLTLDTSASWRRVDQSNPVSQLGDYEQRAGSVGLGYRFSDGLSASAGVSLQRNDYDAVTVTTGVFFPADQSERRDVYLSGTWVPTGRSTVSGRVSIGKTEYERQRILNFDGVTGSVNWAYQATGKLGLNTSVSRDTGQQLAFVAVQSNLPLAGQSVTTTNVSRIADALSVRAQYAVTGKVSADASLGLTRFELASGQSETGRFASAGVRWAATRIASLGCSLSRSDRSGVTADFSTSTVSCFGQIALTL